jgi:hypothetical protein
MLFWTETEQPRERNHTNAHICALETRTSQKQLDAADFVRDVGKPFGMVRMPRSSTICDSEKWLSTDSNFPSTQRV